MKGCYYPRPNARRDPMTACMEKVEPVAESGCWIWTGTLNNKGYAQFSSVAVRTTLVHKFLYEQIVGPIPDGMEIDHLCRVTSCVNPLHLEPVTHAENIRRGYALKPKPTHCPIGHAYTTENIKINSRGAMECRECCTMKWRCWQDAHRKRVS